MPARFHWPMNQDDDYVVVGHVVWQPDDGAPPRIEPAPSLMSASAPVALLATLKHLVLKTAPRSFVRLRALRSRHWTFVRVETEG